MLLGAHVRYDDPLQAAAARNADLPSRCSCRTPSRGSRPCLGPDAAELAGARVPIYVHSPYLVNVGSPNNRISIPSRKIIADTVAAASEIGALGVVVHGGHVGDDEESSRWGSMAQGAGVDRDLTVPVLLENTAGGEKAIVREIDAYERLWDEIGDFNVGVCLDTCHAWASGEDLTTVVERVTAAGARSIWSTATTRETRPARGATATPISVTATSPRGCCSD
jgi:deoxyribonuclease IV